MTIFDEDMNLKWHYRRFNYYRRLMAITYGAMVLSIPAGFVVSIWSEEIGLRVILGGGGSLALSHFTHWIQGNITSAIMDARAREKELREEAEKEAAKDLVVFNLTRAEGLVLFSWLLSHYNKAPAAHPAQKLVVDRLYERLEDTYPPKKLTSEEIQGAFDAVTATKSRK